MRDVIAEVVRRKRAYQNAILGAGVSEVTMSGIIKTSWDAVSCKRVSKPSAVESKHTLVVGLMGEGEVSTAT